jgi:hypothetical protein
MIKDAIILEQFREFLAATTVKRYTVESVFQFLKLHTIKLPLGDVPKTFESLP